MLLKATTKNATKLYISPTSTDGANRGAGQTLWVDFSDVQNGRRHATMTEGGSDWWVPAHDVAPARQAGLTAWRGVLLAVGGGLLVVALGALLLRRPPSRGFLSRRTA